MPRYYDILKEHGESSTGNPPDQISTSPAAMVVVWRYRYPVTFSRKNSGSFSKNPADATRMRDAPLILVEDIATLSVSHTKSNHVSQLNLTLQNDENLNYLTEIFPGDWVACWMVNDLAKIEDLVRRVKNGDACNNFDDGLKFLGRISACRKRMQQNPNGDRNSSYLINAAGFQEFDASVYYEPYLASNAVGIATEWMQKTASPINNLIGKQPVGQATISVNEAIPFFVNMLYGPGVPRNQGFDTELNSTTGLDNQNSFIIPESVGRVLGVEEGTKPSGQRGWNDVCNILHGIQKYHSFVDWALTEVNNRAPEQIFSPDGVPSKGRDLICPTPMLGTFLPSPPQFTGQRTVWSILQQYLNPAVNEMYAALRVGPDGRIMPTLVVRQLPFSSGAINELYQPKKLKVANVSPDKTKHVKRETPKENVDPTLEPRQVELTRFAELPRWLIHPILVKSVDVGRSDSLRFNFIHVYGETGLKDQNRTGHIVRDPPIADDLDILRSGLRPYMTTVNCSDQDARSHKAGDWMYILSDILMGQHLTLTGSIDLAGIQAPICIGDNIEFDEHIFHIETITHTLQIAPNGFKSFRTSLALSHGQKATQLEGNDFSLYSGTDQGDLRLAEGVSSSETTFAEQNPSEPEAGREEQPSPGQAPNLLRGARITLDDGVPE